MVELKSRHVARVAVVADHLAGAVNHRNAQVHHLRSGNGFNGNFDADSVGVADGDADFQSLIIVFAHLVLSIFS